MRVRMSIIRNIVFCSERFGVNPKEFWQKLQLSPAEYEQSDSMVDWRLGAVVWDVAQELSGNPMIGLLCGELSSEMALGLVGHLMQSSPNLETAINNLAKFNLAFSEMFYYRVHTDLHEFRIELAPTEMYWLHYPESARHSVEISMSGILHVAQMLSGRKITPLYSTFSYAGSNDKLATYQRILGKDLRFNQPTCSLVLKWADVKLPVIGYNAELLKLFEQLAKEYIERHQQGSTNVVAMIRKVIMDNFQQQAPSLSEVAKKLGMAERSLQRKLQVEGFTFQQIIEELRSEMAIGLVKRKQFTANEIAYMLGYTDPGAFRRAFKRWTGVNPGEMARG